MIQPTVDFTGEMTQADLNAADLNAIQSQLTYQQNIVQILESLELSNYGDQVVSPGAVSWPYTFATISHGLGYIPQFLVYYKFVSGSITSYQKLPMIRSGADGGSGGALQRKIGYFFKAYADTQNLYIVGGGGFTTGAAQPTGGFIFRYYIFSQPNQTS